MACQGVGGPNAQGQTVQQQLDWYKLIYALVEDNINSGGPLKVTMTSRLLACHAMTGAFQAWASVMIAEQTGRAQRGDRA